MLELWGEVLKSYGHFALIRIFVPEYEETIITHMADLGVDNNRTGPDNCERSRSERTGRRCGIRQHRLRGG